MGDQTVQLPVKWGGKMIILLQQTKALRFHRYKELEDVIQSVGGHLVSGDVDMGFIYLSSE